MGVSQTLSTTSTEANLQSRFPQPGHAINDLAQDRTVTTRTESVQRDSAPARSVSDYEHPRDLFTIDSPRRLSHFYISALTFRDVLSASDAHLIWPGCCRFRVDDLPGGPGCLTNGDRREIQPGLARFKRRGLQWTCLSSPSPHSLRCSHLPSILPLLSLSPLRSPYRLTLA